VSDEFSQGDAVQSYERPNHESSLDGQAFYEVAQDIPPIQVAQ
jgi:hypothetical protein